MSNDRYIRDNLFNHGFGEMERGNYDEGLEAIRIASGSEHIEPISDNYDPATGVMWLEKIYIAARGGVGGDIPKDPAALVFMGSEEEFKGFIERRKGSSPDYRFHGFVNHLGQAIHNYREAERLGYVVAKERLEALELKLGSQDFYNVERTFNEHVERATAHTDKIRSEIMQDLGIKHQPPPEKFQSKKSGCYIATAIYGDYEAAPVRTLRNFRDQTLTSSGLGRAFIRLYYAVSPRLAHYFISANTLNRGAKYILDSFVEFLDKRDYGD